MTVVIPTAVGSPAAGWAHVDWIDPQHLSDPAAAGVATIEVPPVPLDDMWLIDHMVAACDSTTPTVMRLYVGAAEPGRLRDGSDTGNFDVADWPQGLLVRGGSALIARWTGASAGARAVLTLQARVFRRS